MAAWRALARLALMAALLQVAPTGAAEVEILSADDSELTAQIVKDLRRRLPVQAKSPLVIAIGPHALRLALERRPCGRILSAYTSRQIWQALHDGAQRACAARMTAVFAEPDPDAQLRLIALLYPKAPRISAMVGSATPLGLLRTLLPGVHIETLAPGQSINSMLERIGASQVLLALPDSAIYSTENIRNILLSTYRHNQGVIGFSSDMVKAGALATTYSEISDINTQLAEIAAAMGAGALPAPAYPRYFRTIVNEGVARSLGLAPELKVLAFAHNPV